MEGILAGLAGLRAPLTELYEDLHAHPELAFREHRTAGKVADRLRQAGIEVTTGVGGTGVVGVISNGDGPRVLLRADFDALPVTEETGLPYASTIPGVMHACGHDMHVACLLGALELLAGAKSAWSGTIVAIFQPAEEVGSGARKVIADGFFDRFGVPAVVLGQHVAPLPSGWIGAHAGPAFAAQDQLKVTLYGKGGHGSQPETTIDPVVMAAATIMQWQTIVSRQVAGVDTAVVTVGSCRAGTESNIIPDKAELLLSVRTMTEPVRDRVLASIDRIAKAQAQAAGAQRAPDITTSGSFPLLVNDPQAVERTVTAFRARFGPDKVIDPGQGTGSEDVGEFATASGAPICDWIFGGTDPARFSEAAEGGTIGTDIPFNHSPLFAPVVQPTLDTGITAMATAALTWLGPS